LDELRFDGCTAIVTGAGGTPSLGRAHALLLAARGAKVVVNDIGHDPETPGYSGIASAESVAQEIRALGGEATADSHSVADEESAAAIVETALDAFGGIDILVNNAGIIAARRQLSEDGYELTFQVNHLAGFLLTLLLLPPRTVNVASIGQRAPDFGDLMLERGYEPWRAYRQSKLAQIMFAFELAERRPDVESSALHPATFMDTKMVRETVGRPYSTVEEGVEATVRLIAEPGVSGRYFDGTREGAPDPLAYDAAARRRLWEVSERLIA
jgi:NAD(P)-dependent dehydrogenase (short-subunit alcohol dehydrogenase family)